MSLNNYFSVYCKIHGKDYDMKKAIKAVVGMALALSFAVAPAALSAGNSSTSSITTVSANSGFSVRRLSKPVWWNGRYVIYEILYQGRHYAYSDTGRIG